MSVVEIRGKTDFTPGKESLKKAMKVTGSHRSLNSKWMAPSGKRVAWSAKTSLKTNWPPFSGIMPVIREPLETKLNSGDLGCVCGVFIPHGPRKPAAVEKKKKDGRVR